MQFSRSITRAKATPDVAEPSGSCDYRKFRIQKNRLSQNHQPRVKNFDRITALMVEINVASRRAGDRVCEALLNEIVDMLNVSAVGESV